MVAVRRNCRDADGLSSKLKNTLRCKSLKTQGKIVWLGVRDGLRNWLITAA